jgi:hypothetical protein
MSLSNAVLGCNLAVGWEKDVGILRTLVDSAVSNSDDGVTIALDVVGIVSAVAVSFSDNGVTIALDVVG